MYKISRRGLLRTGMAAGVMAATGMPARAGQRGGTLRLAVSGATLADTWDCRQHIDTFMTLISQGAVFDCLTEISASGELIGELAESWEASDNAKIWVFNLRRGVQFHNGAPFGAQDVIASFGLHLDKTQSSPVAPIVESIVDMRALSPLQVQFTLRAGNADFPFLLSDSHLLIYPAGHLAQALTTGIGTGLYRVDHFSAGIGARLVRVESHYKDGRAGWFDAVEVLAVNDADDRLGTLAMGQVDIINDIPFAKACDLRATPGVAVLETKGNRHLSVPLRTDIAPGDNANLRKALKHAIDRNAIVASVLQGHGSLANDHPIGPANQYWHRDMAQTQHDPDQARFYLQQAGLTDLTIDLSLSGAAFAGAAEVGETLQVAAFGSGISIRLQESPADGYWAGPWKIAPWRLSSWSGRLTEDWIFSQQYGAGAAWNETAWDHPRFQQLLLAARSELDSALRQEMYFEMQEICADDGGSCIPVYASYLDAHSKRLGHPEQTGTAQALDSLRVIERWWVA